MQPIWLIEDFDPDDSRTELIKEVERQGFDCKVIRYTPFESGTYDLWDKPDDCVIFQGSLNLGRQLRREKKWIPGVWCSLENFRCRTYYPHYAKYLLNSDYYFLPIMDLKRRQDEIYKHFAVDDCLFIRPDSGFKTFTGRAIPYNEFDADYEWMVEFSDEDSLAVIASPKPIEREYRFVVGDEMHLAGDEGRHSDILAPGGKMVIAGSSYRKDGCLWHAWDSQSPLDRSAWEYVNSLLVRQRITWFPDPIFVIDVCISNDTFYILELNSFSCSGLYACDLSRIVKAASAMAVKEWEDANTDRSR